MIGGIDVHMPSKAGDLSLEVAVRAIRQAWSATVFENGLTAESYDHFGEIPFGEIEELFVYRDRNAAEIWDAAGAVPEASNTMIHLIYGDGWVTSVVDERSDEINRIIAAIESALSDESLNLPALLEAA